MADELRPDRADFAERIRLQLLSRYRGSTVELDPARYSLRLRAPGIDLALPLAALHNAVLRQPARTVALISDFVRSVETRVVPQAEGGVAAARLLWCVRSSRYLEKLGRSDELLTEPVAADLVAFVAESLPGNVMRGVPRGDWESVGMDTATVRRAADENTRARFGRVLERVATIERIPADGWRLAGDSLYESSIVMVPELLNALVQRAGGDILVGLPDRALALVIPAGLPAAAEFQRRVLQEFREAMNPCSREVLRYNGETLTALEHGRRHTSLLPWLRD